MQRLARPSLLLLTLCGVLLWQGGAVSWAQSGTLQLPEHKRVEAAPKAPLPAPRTPVHQEAPPRQTPVIAPRKGEPRHKPVVHHPPAAKPIEHARPVERPGHIPAARPEPQPATAHIAPPVPAKPQKPTPASEPDKGSSTGLPLPRFAALRTDQVNLRSGPGTRYPIEWVYKRRYLPVEIEREFDVWRLVKMPDGTRGWVHQATLTGRRGFDVENQDATLRAGPSDTGAAVAVLKPGVVGRLRSCAAGSAWCRVQVGNYGGYLRRDEIWGTLPNEVIGP